MSVLREIGGYLGNSSSRRLKVSIGNKQKQDLTVTRVEVGKKPDVDRLSRS